MRMPAKSVTKAKAPTFAAVLNRPMGALDHNLNRRAGKAQPKRSFYLAKAAASRYSVEPWLGRLEHIRSQSLAGMRRFWALRTAALWPLAPAPRARRAPARPARPPQSPNPPRTARS